MSLSKLIVLATFLAAGIVYAMLIPPGESPDEPAHVAYVDYVYENRALPPIEAGPFRYEAHQPPLDYVVSAALLRLTGSGPVRYPFATRPLFQYARGEAPAVDRFAAQRLRTLRIARLAWGVLTLLALFAIAERFSGVDRAVATAVLPLALAPQFIFISASVNNDGAIVAIASWALVLLLRTVTASSRAGEPLAAGTVAGLAMFAKASGLFLALPVAVACWFVRHRRGHVAALLGSYALTCSLSIALQIARFGVLFPPMPRPPRSVLQSDSVSLLDPSWIGETWASFWGRFGWMNLDLPAWGYLLFLPATVAVLLGASRYPGEGEHRRARIVLDFGAISLLALYVAYLMLIDWQLQGRYLFPAIGCGVAVLTTRMQEGSKTWHAAIWICSFAAVLLGAATIHGGYR